MTDYASLVGDTAAFKTIEGDKRSGRLSHAYLVISADGKIKEYLKIFAKLMACENPEPCGQCRVCRLIDSENCPDVCFYPKNGTSVLTEDVNDIIEKCYLKPVEGDKKIFIICRGETMNASAQNKLLKTLEEPPRGVHIIIGSASEFPLLPTVRSRTEKLEIPPFSSDRLFAALSGECPDAERLKTAIACGDGTAGKTLELYGDENFARISELAGRVLAEMKSSRQVLKFSSEIAAEKADLEDFFSALEVRIRDLLVENEGRPELASERETVAAEGFNTASLICALEKINEARKRKKFNGNGAMLTEWLLFAILEGKHKWQKS